LPHLKLGPDHLEKIQSRRSKSTMKVQYSHHTVQSSNMPTTERKTSVGTLDFNNFSSKPSRLQINTQRKMPAYRLFDTEALTIPTLPTQKTKRQRVLKDDKSRRTDRDSESSKNDINLTINQISPKRPLEAPARSHFRHNSQFHIATPAQLSSKLISHIREANNQKKPVVLISKAQ